jgi:enoyl reductase-like protein
MRASRGAALVPQFVAEQQLIKERANGAAWHDLAGARDVSPETLRKRIERVRRRIKQSLAEPGTELAAENRRE